MGHCPCLNQPLPPSSPASCSHRSHGDSLPTSHHIPAPPPPLKHSSCRIVSPTPRLRPGPVAAHRTLRGTVSAEHPCLPAPTGQLTGSLGPLRLCTCCSSSAGISLPWPPLVTKHSLFYQTPVQIVLLRGKLPVPTPCHLGWLCCAVHSPCGFPNRALTHPQVRHSYSCNSPHRRPGGGHLHHQTPRPSTVPTVQLVLNEQRKQFKLCCFFMPVSWVATPQLLPLRMTWRFLRKGINDSLRVT